MAFGVNSLMSIGNGALFASQAAIQTTGNNVANVNTVGYSRQSVLLQDKTAIDYFPGQVGQGVEATQIMRSFDRFVENAYLDKATLQRRYEQEHSMLRTVETMFNEANTSGIADSLSKFFQAWSTLSQTPNNAAAREALIRQTQNFTSILNSTDQWLGDLEDQMNGLIGQDVDRANRLMREIADLTREINTHAIDYKNNPNNLLDARDIKVRELSGILDIKVQDNGRGNFMVTTGSGMLLVQDTIPFSLTMLGPRAENHLSLGSTYDGSVEFIGKDGYEYTVEVVVPGTVDRTGSTTPDPSTAQYRVSLDGGRTWMKDEKGSDKLFFATDEENRSYIKDLEIYFTGENELKAGDKFVLTPKSDVYWVSPTTHPLNISSQAYPDGLENGQRITGGTLASYLSIRDKRIGTYRDELTSFSDSLIWEVNRLHTQGSGLEHMGFALGDYGVTNTDVPLNSQSSGLHFGDRLQSGNITFSIYDDVTGENIGYPGIDAFSPNNFDPSKHSLEDVRDAFNSGPLSSYLNASIIDNRLQITASAGYTFGIVSDTSGLAAALGINNYFKGNDPSTISVTDEVMNNINLVNAGRINGAGESNVGDNITANKIAELFKTSVSFFSSSHAPISASFSEFYGTLVSKIGGDTAGVGFLASTEGAMAIELGARREEISGVSLDEEMSNLIKFQSSYKAAAKLITTADEMFQTILSLKQ